MTHLSFGFSSVLSPLWGEIPGRPGGDAWPNCLGEAQTAWGIAVRCLRKGAVCLRMSVCAYSRQGLLLLTRGEELPAWKEVLPVWGWALLTWGELLLVTWRWELPAWEELAIPAWGKALAAWGEVLPAWEALCAWGRLVPAAGGKCYLTGKPYVPVMKCSLHGEN